MKTGRPRKYTPITLRKKADQYFEECENKGKPKTLSGLSIFLGVYRDYISEKAKNQDFSDTTDYIRLVTENDLEEGILTKRYHHRAGEFNLKNNYGWKDKIESINTHEVVDPDMFKGKSSTEVLMMIENLRSKK